jgi:acetoin utilization protein AcuB
MRIEAWMKHPVHTVKPLDSVVHARAILERERINQLPVVSDGHLLGIVTDRDLRDAYPSVAETGVMAPGGDPERVPVESVMAFNVVTLAPTDTMSEAARLMMRERIGALPIVEGKRLVGILTRSDVLRAFVGLCEQVESREHAKPAPVRAGLHATAGPRRR